MNDEEIVQAIQKKGSLDEEVFNFLYRNKEYQAKAKIAIKMVKGIRLENWRDIFHESMIRFITQIRLGKYNGGTKLVAYFSGICRLTCLEKNRREGKEAEFPEFELPPENTNDLVSPLEVYYSLELRELLEQALNNLREKCRDILKLWALKYSSKEIAEILGISTDDIVRVTINRCKEDLRAFLREDPQLYNALKDLRWI